MAVTWADIVAAGRGQADFRLRIEGVREEFCTVGLALGIAGDFIRYPGLERDGLGFSESCYLAGAEQSIQIQPVTIYDDQASGRRATTLFSTIAQVLDRLTITLGSDGVADTTVTCRDSSLLDGAVGYIGTETVVFDAPTTGTTIECERAKYGSTAQAHYVDLGSRINPTPIYDHPPGFVGRRVWLYAHGPGETGLSDAGTVVWRGIIGKEPSESGGAWTLQIEPRTKALDSSLAGGFGDGLKIRGIYYPGRAPLALTVYRCTGATYDPAISDFTLVDLAGFFSSQEAFCAALTAALNANADIVSWGVSFEARTVSDGGWDLYVRTATGTARFVGVLGGTAVDGQFSGAVLEEFTAGTRGGSSGSDSDVGLTSETIAADSMYRCQRYLVPSDSTALGIPGSQLRRVPRSHHPLYAVSTGADDTTWPMTRVYLDRTNGLTALGEDAVIVTGAGEGAVATVLDVVTVTATYVEVAQGGARDRWPQALAAGSYQPTIVGASRYASGSGSLEDFRASVILRAPDDANRAAGPWLIDDDCASWATAVEEAAGGRSWLLERSYTYSKSLRTIEMLREEWKLYGLIPYLDASAKISVRPMTLETRTPSFEIDADNHIIDDGFGSVSGDDDGLVTVVEFKTGYDPIEDSHEGGDTFTVNDLGAIARVKKEAKLEIHPKSRAVGADMTWEDAATRGQTITEIFGARRTQTVEIDATIEAFNVLIGDTVSVTAPQLPGDGTRGIWTAGSGIAARAGIVVSRSWDLASGRGTFRVLLHELSTAGYTPAGWVTAASGATTAWVLTLDATRYSGTSDVAFFAAGDSIILREWDSASPIVREGHIDSVSIATNEVTITLTSAWAGLAGASYILGWDTSDDVHTVTRQLDSAYIASSTGRIALVSGTQPADRFLP